MVLTPDDGPFDPTRSTPSPRRILLVDDEAEVLQVLGEILSSMGYQAETASNGEEALGKLVPQTDLVLLDVKMSGLDGYQVAQRIRKTAATRDVPLIMITALGSREDRLRAVKAGANDFIHKPVDAVELRVRVEAQLRLKEYLDEIKRQRAELGRAYAAEKELVEKTLQGSVRALVDILGLVSPLVFSRVGRIRRLVRQICMNLELSNAWQYEFAAMLSQVGWVAVPPEVTEKHFTGRPLDPDEQKMVDGHPETTAVLLERIPRLGFAAEMIRNQPKACFKEFYSGDLKLRDAATIGSLLLRAVVHYDLLLSQGFNHRDALTALRRAEERNDPAVLTALQAIVVDETGNPIDLEPRKVKLSGLAPEMILGEDLLSRGERGILLARKGQEVSRALLEKLKNAVVAGDPQRQIMVLVPRPASEGP